MKAIGKWKFHQMNVQKFSGFLMGKLNFAVAMSWFIAWMKWFWQFHNPFKIEQAEDYLDVSFREYFEVWLCMHEIRSAIPDFNLLHERILYEIFTKRNSIRFLMIIIMKQGGIMFLINVSSAMLVSKQKKQNMRLRHSNNVSGAAQKNRKRFTDKNV